MLKVLGYFSDDCAALYSVNRNNITNELSLFSQKDGNPICFFHSNKLLLTIIYIYINILSSLHRRTLAPVGNIFIFLVL